MLIRIFGERFFSVQLPIELEGTDRETNEPDIGVSIVEETLSPLARPNAAVLVSDLMPPEKETE